MSDKITSVTAKDDPGVIEKARLDSLVLVEETRVIVGKKYQADREEAGAEVEAVRAEAGEAELAKNDDYFNSPKAKGSAEAQVYGEVALHSTGMTALEVAKTGYDVLARGQDPAANHGLGPNVKTMDQITKSVGTKGASSKSIKTPFIENTADGLLGRANATGDFRNQSFGMKNQEGKLGGKYVATTEVVGGLKLASLKKLAMANKAAFEQTQEVSADIRNAPAGPGGVGSNAPAANQPVYASKALGMHHDKIGQPRPTDKFLRDNNEESETYV